MTDQKTQGQRVGCRLGILQKQEENAGRGIVEGSSLKYTYQFNKEDKLATGILALLVSEAALHCKNPKRRPGEREGVACLPTCRQVPFWMKSRGTRYPSGFLGHFL